MSDTPSSENPAAGNARTNHAKAFASHVTTMPAWHKIAMVLGLVVMGAGIAGQIKSRGSTSAPAAVQSAPPATPPGNAHPTAVPGSGFVGPGPAPSTPTTPSTPAPAADSTTTTNDTASKISPWMTRIGGSLVGGFIIGWIFRSFLKTMSLVAMLFFGLLSALSYFNIINADFSAAAHKDYDSATAWVSDQGEKVGTAVVHHMPSVPGGVLGLFMGFKRK